MKYLKYFENIDPFDEDEWDEEETNEIDLYVEPLNSEDYIYRHIHGGIETMAISSYMNDFGIGNFNRIMIKSSTDIGVNGNLYTFLIHEIGKNSLDRLFPNGVETDELGEGADDLDLDSKVYFFKIKDNICCYEYDHRGTQLRLPRNINMNTFEEIIRTLFKYISDNEPNFIEEIRNL